MFISKKKLKTPGTYSVQLVESNRVAGKVKQTIIQYIGYAQNEAELKDLVNLGEQVKSQILNHNPPDKEIKSYLNKQLSKIKGCSINIHACEELYRKIIGIHDVYLQVLKFLNLYNFIENSEYNEILRHIIMARIYRPSSKRHSAQLLQTDFAVNIHLDQIYRALDKIDDDIIASIKHRVYQSSNRLLKNGIKVLFYDATTLYFESFQSDELRQNGYSKDLKFNQPQVVLTVLVTNEGLPIGYEVFSGSTYEGHTLQTAIETINQNYKDIEMVLVADSGMLNQDNIAYLETKNIKYILGARLKNQTKKVTAQILSFNASEDKEAYKIIELNENKSLVVSYREIRAKKDKHDREKAIERLKKKLEKAKDPKSLLSNYGHKKFICMTGDTVLSINEAKITAEEKWDGLHGVITNIKGLPPDEIYYHYRGLWQVEDAFRVNKTDLRIRPIYHWTPQKVKAHLAISYIAFSCVRTLQYLLKEQGHNISCKEITYNLSRVISSVWQDRSTNKNYCMPSKPSDTAATIYKAISVAWDTTPYELA